MLAIVLGLSTLADDLRRKPKATQGRGISVRVGMEATGYSRWFERLLAELGFELSIGDPAEIKAKRVKKQKLGTLTARLLLQEICGSWFGRFLSQSQMHTFKTAVLLGMTRLDARNLGTSNRKCSNRARRNRFQVETRIHETSGADRSLGI
jgi:hypothetical protein